MTKLSPDTQGIQDFIDRLSPHIKASFVAYRFECSCEWKVGFAMGSILQNLPHWVRLHAAGRGGASLEGLPACCAQLIHGQFPDHRVAVAVEEALRATIAQLPSDWEKCFLLKPVQQSAATL